ncbi:MAG: LamG domain-containing protein [Euryarchaeota archaeon]|nr:LamG domain-containing protein [Euryarchaeota archaeon]
MNAQLSHWEMKRNRFISFLALLSLFCMLFLPTGKAQTGTTFTADATMDTYIDFGRGLDIEALDTLKDGDQLTITFWMRWLDKNNADVDNWANIFTLSDSSGSGDNGVFWMQHKNDNSKLEFAIHSTGRNYIQSSTTVQDSEWYHVAAVYNGSLFSNNMRLYINGSQESSRNKTGNLRATPNKSKLTAGRWSNPGNDYREFHGELDEISLWNIALSEDQIDTLMVNHEAITGTGCYTAGLLGF